MNVLKGKTRRLFFAIPFLFDMSSAAAQSGSDAIDQWLDAEKKPAQVGRDFNFEPEETREQGVGFLADMFGRGEKVEDIATLLCITKPWSTGNDDTDLTFQRLLWSSARDNGDIASDHFKRLDCAGANRKNFYFDTVIKGMQDVKLQLCTHGEIEDLPTTAQTVLADILKVNSEIDADFRGSDTLSYYPLRNVVRGATVAAMLAVHDGVERRSDELARQGLENAAELLRGLNQSDILTRTRNGWRFHSDLTLLEAIYSGIANDNDTSVRILKDALDWPPVVKDAKIVGGISEDMLDSVLPEDYTDPVFIERLLPGASPDAKKECNRWRSRSYRPDAVAERALDCLGEIEGMTAMSDRIPRFDDCFEQLIADDWRIQFSSYPSTSEESAKEALREIKETLLEMDLDKVAALVKFHISSKGMTVISTESEFTTTEIDEMRPLILKGFGRVLYAREPQY